MEIKFNQKISPHGNRPIKFYNFVELHLRNKKIIDYDFSSYDGFSIYSVTLLFITFTCGEWYEWMPE